MGTSFFTQQPNSEFLRSYISYYYFHTSTNQDDHTSFTFYPHFKNAITIYNGSNVRLAGPTHAVVTPNATATYLHAYSHIIKSFGKSEITSPFEKIGIVFQPLGLNHFLASNFAEVITQEFTLNFSYFESSLNPVLDELRTHDNMNKRIDLLDKYFVDKFVGFKDQRMIRALELIFEGPEKRTVQELSDKLTISRKTLLRLFRKHMNCSVQDYISLVQFRKAVELYQTNSEKSTFTGIALDLNYYDQSDFIHHFTKITGVNPKKFFKNIVKYGNQSTFWTPDKKL